MEGDEISHLKKVKIEKKRIKMWKNSRIFATTTVPSSGNRGYNCCCGFTENSFEKKWTKNASKFLHCARIPAVAALTLSLFTRKTPVAIHFSRHIFS